MNSLQLSHLNNKSLNTNFNQRINTLHNDITKQLESVPKTNLSLKQIIDLIPNLFRFLRKNLQLEEKLSDEYNSLSNNIQNIISTFSHYIHDRRDYENEFFSLKDNIKQLIGRIGYTEYRLEQYWTIIYNLEHELERLQILLRNPKILQVNLQKFQAAQDTQRFRLDRFIKENERLKILIKKQKNSIQTIQKQIEIDIKEFHRLKPIFDKTKSEEKDIINHWLQIGLSSKRNLSN